MSGPSSGHSDARWGAYKVDAKRMRYGSLNMIQKPKFWERSEVAREEGKERDGGAGRDAPS